MARSVTSGCGRCLGCNHQFPRAEIVRPNRRCGCKFSARLQPPISTSGNCKASWNFLKENYYVGPAASIVPRSFPVHLIHKDGYEICCRAAVICRYDGNGGLAEAWGTIQHCQDQCNLNCLLEWWPRAEPSELAALNEIVELAAA